MAANKLKRMKYIQDEFTVATLLLGITGLLINLLLSKLVIFLELPLYLDNVGSVIVAILGGPLLGMTVGFLSNVLGSISTPISMYYCIITILIAWVSAVFARRGLLGKVQGWCLLTIIFALLGGLGGGVLTWFLYGQTLSGFAAQYEYILASVHISPFLMQLCIDSILDVPDKFLTLLLVFTLLHLCPQSIYTRFSHSQWYYDSLSQSETRQQTEDAYRRPLKQKLITVVTLPVVVVGLFALVSSTIYYQKQVRDNCLYTAQMISAQAAICVNGDALGDNPTSDSYRETVAKLNSIYYQIPEAVHHVYVCKLSSEGIDILYDLNTMYTEDGSLSAERDHIAHASMHKDTLLSQHPNASGILTDDDDVMLLAYTPIDNADGEVVAYACADIDAELYRNDILIYVIQNAALLFAVILLAVYISLWFVQYHVTNPIQRIVDHTRALGEYNPDQWLTSPVWTDKEDLHTGDELQELYEVVTTLEQNASINVQQRIDAEQELVQTRALEEANQKLEMMIQKADEAVAAKNEFYSRMSHDMRTPMNGVLGITNLAKSENDPVKLHAELEKIRSSGMYMLSLINDTLDLQRMESNRMVLNPEIAKAKDIVDSLMDMVRDSATEKGVQIEVDKGNSQMEDYLLLDPVRVRQVFINLLSNAVKFTPKGGKVIFSIEVLNRTKEKVSIIVQIIDTGIGMSPEFLQHSIFTPFMQEKNDMTMQYAGSGLGLSIVKKLLDMMGATVEVTSELGTGTTFRIFMDLTLASEEEVKKHWEKEKKEIADNQAALVGKRVLLCEDHPLNAEIAKRLLSKVSCGADWAENGKLGVEMFQSHPAGYYDGILMDIRMPVMNGLETAAAIRSLARPDAQTIPIIAMSANAYKEDIEKSTEAGMNAHLVKPVDPQLFYETLAEFLQK